MTGVEFAEQVAIVLALEESDADSGNHDALDAYLRENFLGNELRKLGHACDLLSSRAFRIAAEMRREASR